MRPSKPALPEWARPQDLAPTVENARRLGLPQAAQPEAQHGSPPPSTTQQPAEPSWGQRLNRNMRQWGEGVIDRLDEAAVADGGGLVTALAALARTPARSFTSFMQGTAGTVSLLDGRVRGEISDGLSQVMSDPGLIGRAASDYWRSRTLTDMAADLYANGATGAMMGGAGTAALGRLNRLPGLGRDVGEIGQAAMRNISASGPSSGGLTGQRSAVGIVNDVAAPPAIGTRESINITTGVRTEIPVSNDVIDNPRIGYGAAGEGSGNKVDVRGIQRVNSSDGNPIAVYGHKPQSGEPYAYQEFPSTPIPHGFPDVIDNYAGYGHVFLQNDGSTLIQLAGHYNGKPGRFEWIIDPNMGGVSHRMFVLNGAINGRPSIP